MSAEGARVPRGVRRRLNGIVYLNGRFVAARAARVSALDRGLLYGDGLFETVRTYRGRPFALDRHFDRLAAGAHAIALPLPFDERRCRRIISGLLRRNPSLAGEAAVRLTVTRGPGGDWLLPPARPKPTVLATLRPPDPRLPRLRRRGVKVVVLPFHPGFGGLLAPVKTVDYLTAQVGKALARRRGAFEGIYSSPSGEIFEGTTSNLFVVRRRSLVTPPVGRGIRPGVTREIVIGLAGRAGVRVEERRLGAKDLLTAEEAFLTATTIEVLPIRAVGAARLPVIDGITRLLQQGYTDLRRASW